MNTYHLSRHSIQILYEYILYRKPIIALSHFWSVHNKKLPNCNR